MRYERRGACVIMGLVKIQSQGLRIRFLNNRVSPNNGPNRGLALPCRSWKFRG